GGLEPEFSDLDRARCAILPVPYDFTTSYQGGTRSGPRAILEASRNMELWDEELGATYRAGIHTLPELEPTALGPEAMLDREEQAQFLRREPAPMWSTRQFRALGGKWQPVLSALTEEVYVTFDLDALDPSILPATGTPEPGGLDWFEAVDLLRAVSERASIVGFDIVELAPIPGQVASDFLAARLTYRAIGLA